MNILEWLVPSLAFLAPLPPMRPEPPKPLGGNEWAATVVIGSVCLMMVLPMITIWSFWGPHDSFRVRCEASGGHVLQDPAVGVAPYRCDRSRSLPARGEQRLRAGDHASSLATSASERAKLT